MKTFGYAAYDTTSPLAPYAFERRTLRGNDVAMEIIYCGVCHSDLHTARNDWGWSYYPIVPGHEIVGRVIEVGPDVSRYKVGDHVAVGCMVDSCMECDQCHRGEEQLCRQGMVGTYAGADRISGEPTQGGYAKHLVVREEFCLRMPDGLDLSRAAPLLCAGITTWSPLRHWKVGPGQKVGVIGLGGLGHMGVKFAKALGAHVVMITTTPEKGADAKRLGADEVLVSRDAAQMKAHAGSFDFLLNTIPVGHDTNPYMGLLKREATMCLVGVLTELDPPLTGSSVIFGRKHLTGSAIGGMAETQEMMDFCAEHGIVSDVEMIDIKNVNEAWERMAKNDVRYRFVIDMATIKA